MYVCGATVQDTPHLGHIRGAVNFDVLRRWLVHNGLDVHYVRNVTDIDDQIITKADDAGRPWWEWAATHERHFEEAFDALGCLPPSASPRATGHITQMVELITRLIDSGHAYQSGGDVYFAVHSFPDYGRLSGQQPQEVQQGESAAEGKRDHRDFTLWKGAKAGEPAWPTPWGSGRPGWHLECSAMATTYLGGEFDIHGGGIDLVFPHHENERAQSQATGDPFAQFWLHNSWVTLSGEKMSKSVGNVLAIPALLEKARPHELRYFLVQPHYRSTIEFSDEALSEAATAYRRIEHFLRRAHDRIGEITGTDVPAEFTAALDDDLATPQACAVLHNTVRDGNTALDGGTDEDAARHAASARAMSRVLGLDPFSAAPATGTGADTNVRHALATLVENLLAERDAARAQRDYARADELRDLLSKAGVAVEDTTDGPTWTVQDSTRDI